MATKKQQQPAAPLPEWYTVEEAMKILRVSRNAITSMRRRGEIEWRQVGRRVLLPWYEVRTSRDKAE
jgi:excisionase family DNA binding protein